jgi:type III secretory pathway component EscT
MAMSRLLQALRSRVAVAKDAGMSTAEYCVGIVAAVAFAMVLWKAVSSGSLIERLIGSVIDHVIHLIPGL